MHRFFYRLTLGALALLLLACTQSYAIPVTGHVAGPGQSVPAGMSVKFELYNCGGNYPRVVGSFGIVQQNFTLTPDLTGLLTGSIVPNDIINCGGVTGTTRYYVTMLLNGVPQIPTACYAVLSSMGTFNLDTATPCTSATPPPPPGGPYDATYNNLTLMGLLSGNNATFSGIVQAHQFLLDATPTPCPTGYMTGFTAGFGVLCGTPASAPVTSVFTRGGDVTAQTGDYNCSQITGAICSIPTLNYQTVKVTGTPQTQRAAINFLSAGATTVTCADNPGNNSTDCTVNTPTGSAVSRTCNANGCYTIDADGTIRASGNTTSPSTSGSAANVTATFPYPFTTTTNLVVVVSPMGSPGGDGNPHPLDCHVNSITTTGAAVVIAIPTQISGAGYASPLLSSQSCSWIAVGH